MAQPNEDSQSMKKRARLLDNDRQKYAQTVQNQMLKQSDTINSLKKENDKLKQELAATTGGSYSFGEQDRLMQLQHESEALDRKIQFEKMRQADLDKRTSLVKLDVMCARRDMGGVNITADNTQLIEKQVRVLENRLDQALVKFNEALSLNKDLRQHIDNLRGERKVFNDIYKKLEMELHEKKRQMAEVIEQSNKDYEERDSLQAQLEALKEAAKVDAKKYDEHFQALEVMMQQYKNAREQQQQAQLQQQLQQQQQQLTKSSSPKQSTREAPKRLEKHEQEEVAPEQEGDLQDVVDQLKEATGIQDLDVLFNKFVKAEEHNFSMYNFVNELNSEVELLDTEIEQLKDTLHSEKGDIQRRKLLKDLENELASVEQQHDTLTEKSTKLKGSLGVVRAITQEIFTKVGCSNDVAQEQLGTSECTDINLLQFLGLIEQRTNEIMFAYNMAAANELKKRAASKDEESRKKRERRQADRQARIEAGEAVADEPDDEEEEPDDQVERIDKEAVRAKFVGVGPSVPHGVSNASQLVHAQGLPNTNAGDGGTGDNNDDIEEDTVLSHEVLRQQMEHRIQMKRDKDERGDRRKQRDRDRVRDKKK